MSVKRDLCFADPCDQVLDEQMIEEMYWSHIARHKLHILNHAATGADLYGDPDGEPVYDQTVELPVHVKLDPEEEELNRYGYDRNRDAILWFSRKIVRDLSIEPKVGDRLDFTYRTPSGSVVNEHLIITEISYADFQRQNSDYYQISASANRTERLYKPDPPGTPDDPKDLPFDADCINNM